MAKLMDRMRALGCLLDQHDPSERRRQKAVIDGVELEVTPCRTCKMWLARDHEIWRVLTEGEREKLRRARMQEMAEAV